MELHRRIEAFRVLSIVGVLSGLFWAGPAGAQAPTGFGTSVSGGNTGSPGIGVVAPSPAPPSPEFGFEESLPMELGSIREQEAYPERIRAPYAPAFLRGATKTVRTSQTSGMRIGLSGWTATRIPGDDQNVSGGPALGLTIEWGKPMEPETPPPTPK